VLTDHVLASVIALARQHHVPVGVDPKSANLSRYAGASVVTPHTAETTAATGIAPTSDALAEVAGPPPSRRRGSRRC
jgi:D-beta-D-heptose 7-phosphate kinase/D-beta-D-heptose 1-phosphate adenosyltransferase